MMAYEYFKQLHKRPPKMRIPMERIRASSNYAEGYFGEDTFKRMKQSIESADCGTDELVIILRSTMPTSGPTREHTRSTSATASIRSSSENALSGRPSPIGDSALRSCTQKACHHISYERASAAFRGDRRDGTKAIDPITIVKPMAIPANLETATRSAAKLHQN